MPKNICQEMNVANPAMANMVTFSLKTLIQEIQCVKVNDGNALSLTILIIIFHFINKNIKL